ncbi:hypothetical protein G647_00353 [Cladophialophora carrionii CBS 160.54]|uniref:Uncharacterized protein n=1 Tax=Cladophialophora carrionii CBS 160.54 TaxID=1279043 RepID=V9DLY1_9EURO|nr:uncharacterized protein G647_00353 [Cladophialophora carrionii CBS 160.54]ETI27904.1 hypothetical protein G647_00353 [Cladophialophora carrionii CBS 160.54]
MQLRSSITIPTRLEDEEPATPKNRNGTKPAHPGLMRANTTPFNPDNPPAAFPSLPLTSMAMSVENKNVSEAATTGDNVTENSIPNEGSLAGVTSAIHRQEDSQVQTSQIGVKVEQDETQQDQTHKKVTQNDGSADNAMARAITNQDKATVATSSTTTTQTVSIDAQTVEYVSTPSEHISSSGVAQAIGNQDAAATAMSTSNGPRVVQQVKWNELPLSMQYHIYKAMKEYPVHPGYISRALGMNATQIAQIEHAVGLRAIHPASLVDLWAFCASISMPIPGIRPDMQDSQIIDPDIFQEYAEYFTFVCKYDWAFDGEVRLARKFLMDHNLSLAFMGQWVLDPHGSGYRQFVPYVPSTRTTPLANAWRPLYGAVQNAAMRQFRPRPGLLHGIMPSGRAVAARNARRHPALHGRPALPSDPAASAARALVDQRTERAGRQRHPLAQVSTPGESSTPPQTGQQSAQDIVQPVPTGARNPASRRNPRSHLSSQDTPSALGQPIAKPSGKTDSHQDLPSSMKPKNALQRARGSRAQQNGHEKRGDETVQNQSTSTPAPASLRLVLKIDNKDGLAQVLRNAPPKAANPTISADPFKSTAMSDVAQNGSVHAPQTVSSRALPFSTTMSGFSRGLVMGLPSTSAAASAADSVFAIPAARAPTNHVDNLHRLVKAAPDHPKRKSSQSEIRPGARKAPRVEVADTHATHAHGLVSAGIDSMDRLHTETDKAHESGNGPKNITRGDITPTQATNMFSDIGAGELSGDFANNYLPKGVIAHRPLPSPTFSAISENADLPEFRALLRPVKHRLRGKVPAFGTVDTPKGGDIAVSTPLTPVAELHLLQNIPTPEASGTGETNHEDTSEESSIATGTSKKTKNKTQKLKLIVGPRSKTPTSFSSGRDSASVHGSGFSMGTIMIAQPPTSAIGLSATPESIEEKAVKLRRSARLARKLVVNAEKREEEI